MTPAPSGQSSPRLGLLSSIRLGANGSFRYLYPFLAVVAADLSVPDQWAGVLVGSLAVGGMASPLLRRVMVGQRERPRQLLAWSGLVVAAGTVGLAAAPGVVVAVVTLFCLGAGKPLLDTACIAYVSARTSFERRARATSTMELTWAGGLIVVAPLAGWLANRTSWRAPLVVLGATIALLVLVAWFRLEPDSDDGGEPARPRRVAPGDIAGEAHLPTRPPRSKRLELTAAARAHLLVVAFAFGALEATFSAFGLWLDRLHGVDLDRLGGFAAVVAIGELLGAGAITLLADRHGKAATLRAGLAICALGLGGLALSSSLGLGLGALAVGLVGSEMAIVASIAIASEVQPDARSRYLAMMFAITSLTRAVIGGVGPAVFTNFGIVGNVTLSILAAAGAALALQRAIRRAPNLAG